MHFGNISLGEPLLICKVRNGLSLHFDVVDAGVLSQGMITKYVNPFDFSLFCPCFGRNLRNGSVVVQSCEASDVLLFDSWRIMAQNESVGIGRIGNNETLDIRISELKSLGLLNKDNLIEVQ